MSVKNCMSIRLVVDGSNVDVKGVKLTNISGASATMDGYIKTSTTPDRGIVSASGFGSVSADVELLYATANGFTGVEIGRRTVIAAVPPTPVNFTYYEHDSADPSNKYVTFDGSFSNLPVVHYTCLYGTGVSDAWITFKQNGVTKYQWRCKYSSGDHNQVVKAGTYDVSITCPGYYTSYRTKTVSTDTNQLWNFTLVPVSSGGK